MKYKIGIYELYNIHFKFIIKIFLKHIRVQISASTIRNNQSVSLTRYSTVST